MIRVMKFKMIDFMKPIIKCVVFTNFSHWTAGKNKNYPPSKTIVLSNI